jgi:Histidine kinase-like ATPase domain
VDHAHNPNGSPGDETAGPLAQPRLAPMGCWRRTFPGEPRQLSELRRWIASVLPPLPLRDDVTSVADELASNAICHTRSGQGGEFAVEIIRHGRLVRVMVTDGGAPGGPSLVDKPDGEGGRGLVVVNALAVRAGVDGDHHRRVVWADIDWAADDAAAAAMPLLPVTQADHAAIRGAEVELARRFDDVPIWYGRATHAWWALTRTGLATAPTAAGLAELLSRLPEARPTSVTPGHLESPKGKIPRCA